MKIAVWHNLPSGGGKRALYHHVRGLVARGHVVEIWCPEIADPNYLPLSPLAREHVLPFGWKPKTSGGELARLWRSYCRVPDQIQAMNRHCLEVADQINRGGFDLLFANACQLFAAGPIARYVTIPTALYLPEPYRFLYEALPTLPWLALPGVEKGKAGYLKAALISRLQANRAQMQGRYELENVRACGEILVNSFFSRESLLRAYGVRSHVCYLGIDTELFRPLGLARENYVLGFGAMQLSKGVDRAIRAVGALDRAIRPVLLWIGNTADPDYLKEMEALARAQDVAFSFLRGLSDNELVEHINRARAMLYTSRLEPFGFAPLEANACGVPVIGIAEGGIRETIQHGVNGLLAEQDDPEDIAHCLRLLLDQPEFAERLGVQARQHVLDNWTWERGMDRLERAFARTLGETPPAPSSLRGAPIPAGSE